MKNVLVDLHQSIALVLKYLITTEKKSQVVVLASRILHLTYTAFSIIITHVKDIVHPKVALVYCMGFIMYR